MQIIDPAGVRIDDVRGLARRPDSLVGVRLGLLHNGKPGGERLLERVGGRLMTDHRVGQVRSWRKPHPSAAATFLHELTDACDVVVGALSD